MNWIKGEKSKISSSVHHLFLNEKFHRNENKHRMEIQNGKCLHFSPFESTRVTPHNFLTLLSGVINIACNLKSHRLLILIE